MIKTKKVLLTLVAGFAVVASAAMFAAYEAHVINVTAHIENALYVHPESRAFGTVFPQEYREMGLQVSFSTSFSATDQTRVSNIKYKIVQKPKPRPEYEDSVGVSEARKWCHDNYPIEAYPGLTTSGELEWTDYLANCYPSLCPYLSKTPDGHPEPGNDVGVPAFHDPWTAIATGVINKNGVDVSDTWTIDLAVPCFEGMCAQDWDEFVDEHDGDTNANPDDYMLPADLESKTFGCDLWIEVTRIY